MKKCTKCNIEKEASDFNNRKSSKDGLCLRCKSCVKEYYKANVEKIKERDKKYYKANADKKKEQAKEYRKTNSDKIRKYYKANKDKANKQSKEYYKANADKLKEWQKEYYKANVEKIKERDKKYYKANADKISKQSKEYYKANADKITEKSVEYRKANADKIKEYRKANADKINKNIRERRETDPLFKFTWNTRCLIRGSFKRGIKNLAKSKRTEEILGCSIPFFSDYIKGQFTKGMTLENYGEWHLDHINPVSVATTEEEVIELNHYTNFQPLWAFDNLSKNNKLVQKQLKFL